MGPVLCCLDDSDGARQALAVARTLAARLELELELVHVEPPTEAPGVSAARAGQQRLRETELHDAESLLVELAREAGLGPSFRARTTIGDAAKQIVALCGEERASFVVLVSRGRGGLSSALLGSVSSEVAARAPCACVIVPRPRLGMRRSPEPWRSVFSSQGRGSSRGCASVHECAARAILATIANIKVATVIAAAAANLRARTVNGAIHFNVAPVRCRSVKRVIDVRPHQVATVTRRNARGRRSGRTS